MRILITGGAGYLGSYIKATLFEKMSRSSPSCYPNMVVIDNLMYDQGLSVHRDLNNLINHDCTNFTTEFITEIKRADVILPLAAIVGMPACEKAPFLSRDVNVNAVERLMSYVSDKQIVIGFNTNSGYGNVPNGICTEETPLNSISLYGKQKDQYEQIVMRHKNAVAFRLATVFGRSPRMRLDLLVNTMVYEAYFNGKIEIFDPHYSRNYIHIDDIARAVSHAIKNIDSMKGNVYNLGDDEANCTKLELAKKIKNIVPCNISINEKQKDPDQRNYRVSSQKLYDTGFECRGSLEDEISNLAHYYSFFPSKDENRTKIEFSMRNV